MDKLKNILSPGHAKDDAVLYGNESPEQQFANKGAVTGEGSHFPTGDITGGNLQKTSTEGVFDVASHRTPGAFIEDDTDAATTASVKSGIPGEPQDRPFTGGVSQHSAQPNEDFSKASTGGQSHGIAGTTGKHREEPVSTFASSKSDRDLPPTSSAATQPHSSTNLKTTSQALDQPRSNTAASRGTEQSLDSVAPVAVAGKTTFTELGTQHANTPTSSNAYRDSNLSGTGSKASDTVAAQPKPSNLDFNTAPAATSTTAKSTHPTVSHTQSLAEQNKATHDDNSGTAPLVGVTGSHTTETAKRLDPNYQGAAYSTTPASTVTAPSTADSAPTQPGAIPSTSGHATAQETSGVTSAAPQLSSSADQAGSSPRAYGTGQKPTVGSAAAADRQNVAQTSASGPIGIATTSGAGIPATGQSSSANASTVSGTQQHSHANQNAALASVAGAGVAGVATSGSQKTGPSPSDTQTGGASTYPQAVGSIGGSGPQTQTTHDPVGLSSSTQTSTTLPTKDHSATPSYGEQRKTGFQDGPTVSSHTGQSHSSAQDAAIVGGASGAAGGLAASELGKNRKTGAADSSLQNQSAVGSHSRFKEGDLGSSGTILGDTTSNVPYGTSKGSGSAAPVSGASSEAKLHGQPAHTEDHSTRNKTLLGGAAGGAVVGAGGLAAYESQNRDASGLGSTSSSAPLQSSQASAPVAAPVHDDKEVKKLEKDHEKEVKKAEKEHDKEVKAIAKEEAKESKKAEKQAQKDEEKAVKKEEKEHEKQAALIAKQHEKEEKKAEKEAKKEEEKAVKQEEKEHDKQAAVIAKEHQKEEKKAEKEAHMADEKETEEKKPSLVHRLLHRHDKDKETDESPKRQEEGLHDPDTGRALHANNPHETAERSTSNDTEHFGLGKTTHEAYETTEGHNKLHKKNPPEHVLEKLGSSTT